jgi:MinD superfamily P-loop ATPase
MTIAVASGKGGTGKTTIAMALAQSQSFHGNVALVDCDVEAPNAHLFCPIKNQSMERYSIQVPQLDTALCTGCGACVSACQFNAIAIAGTKAMVFQELCHACGRCIRHCPHGALREHQIEIASITHRQWDRLSLHWGTLDIGQTMTPQLITALRNRVDALALTIIDAPPGTSCAMVSAVRNVDYVLLVAEPSPFGLNDLELAVETVANLKINHGVVINRSGASDYLIEDFCKARKLSLLLKIPDQRIIAENLARSQTLIDTLPEYARVFDTLYSQIQVNSGQVPI